jgi:hypothetical protein
MSPRRGGIGLSGGEQGGAWLRSSYCNIDNYSKRLYMGGSSPEDKTLTAEELVNVG